MNANPLAASIFDAGTPPPLPAAAGRRKWYREDEEEEEEEEEQDEEEEDEEEEEEDGIVSSLKSQVYCCALPLMHLTISLSECKPTCSINISCTHTRHCAVRDCQEGY